MRITKINYFFNFRKKNIEKYTFNKEEHEIILLKKLDDNKIFYNNIIYEENFLYYHKLEHFINKIYRLRDEFIILSFKAQYKSLIKNKKSKKYFYGYKGKYVNLNAILRKGALLDRWQYDILVKAYKYEFIYLLDYDLLDSNRKPIFHELPYFKRPLINSFFKDWFYIVGWNSIKRVYPVFERPLHSHYKEILRKKEQTSFRDSYSHKDLGALKDIGTELKMEWIQEYDPQKKYDEYDINCKTNSYYTRYIPYNEVYNKDYPEEKKFKTDLIHDFTEDEIKSNYNNMVTTNIDPMDRWNYVMRDKKYKDAVMDFFRRLEKHELTRKAINNYYRPQHYWYDEEGVKEDYDNDNDDLLGKEIEEEIYVMLNDPRYLLAMPLVDAYFEIFREEGWYDPGVYCFEHFYPTEKKIIKQLSYYDMSYERHYQFDILGWSNADFYEIEALEYEEYSEDEFWMFSIAIFLFSWLTFAMVYSMFTWFHFPFGATFARLNESLSRSYEYIINQSTTRSYFGLELKSPRYRYHSLNNPHIRRRLFYFVNRRHPRLRFRSYYHLSYRLRRNWIHYKAMRGYRFPKAKMFIFPPKIYDDMNYTFRAKRTWARAPFEILFKIDYLLDKGDEIWDFFDKHIRIFGYKSNIYRFRVIFVEDAMPVELQLFVPKIKKFIFDNIILFLEFVIYVLNRLRLDSVMQLAVDHNSMKYKKYSTNIEKKMQLENKFNYYLGRHKSKEYFHKLTYKDFTVSGEFRKMKKYMKRDNAYERNIFFTTTKTKRICDRIIQVAGIDDANKLFDRVTKYHKDVVEQGLIDHDIVDYLVDYPSKRRYYGLKYKFGWYDTRKDYFW